MNKARWVSFAALALAAIFSVVVYAGSPVKGEYLEDFSQQDEWFGQIWNSRGFIEMTQETESRIRSIHCPYDLFGPFFEIEVLFVRCDNGLAGIELVPSDASEHDLNYAVMINPHGQYAIFRSSLDGSTWFYSKGWTCVRSLNQGTGAMNQIQIEVKPRYTVISFNGEMATTLKAEVTPGAISLAVGSFEGPTTVRFDNLWVHKGQDTE